MTLPTFDWNECLKLSGGKAEIAKEFLSLFKKELPSFKDKLTEAISASDKEALHHHIHKLRGASSYAGVPNLKAISEEFQNQLNHSNKEKISKLGERISNEIDHVLREIEQRL